MNVGQHLAAVTEICLLHDVVKVPLGITNRTFTSDSKSYFEYELRRLEEGLLKIF